MWRVVLFLLSMLMARHVCETPGLLVAHGFYFQCYFSMLTSHFWIQNESLSLEPELTSQITGQKSGPCLVFSFGPCRSGVVTWSEETLHLWRVWMESTGCNPSWVRVLVTRRLFKVFGMPPFLLSFGRKELGIYAQRIVLSFCCRNKFRVNPSLWSASGGLLWQKLLFTAWKSNLLNNMSYRAFSSTHKSWRRIRVFNHVPTQANTISCSWN